MGAGFRVFDIRMDYVVHLGFTLVAILSLGFGFVTLMSSRTKAGRASLLSAMGLFIFSHLITVISSMAAMMPNPMPGQWFGLIALASRFVFMGGLGFLILGLRDLLQRNELLETLQEESLDDRD